MEDNSVEKYLREAYRMLDERAFEMDDIDIPDLKKFTGIFQDGGDDRDGDYVDEITVMDPKAFDQSEIEDSYDGDVNLQCNVCKNFVVVPFKKVKTDEESKVACEDMTCPWCGATSGFIVYGKTKDIGDPEDDDEDDIDLDGTDDSSVDDTELEDTDLEDIEDDELDDIDIEDVDDDIEFEDSEGEDDDFSFDDLEDVDDEDGEESEEDEDDEDKNESFEHKGKTVLTEAEKSTAIFHNIKKGTMTFVSSDEDIDSYEYDVVLRPAVKGGMTHDYERDVNTDVSKKIKKSKWKEFGHEIEAFEVTFNFETSEETRGFKPEALKRVEKIQARDKCVAWKNGVARLYSPWAPAGTSTLIIGDGASISQLPPKLPHCFATVDDRTINESLTEDVIPSEGVEQENDFKKDKEWAQDQINSNAAADLDNGKEDATYDSSKDSGAAADLKYGKEDATYGSRFDPKFLSNEEKTAFGALGSKLFGESMSGMSVSNPETTNALKSFIAGLGKEDVEESYDEDDVRSFNEDLQQVSFDTDTDHVNLSVKDKEVHLDSEPINEPGTEEIVPLDNNDISQINQQSMEDDGMGDMTGGDMGAEGEDLGGDMGGGLGGGDLGGDLGGDFGGEELGGEEGTPEEGGEELGGEEEMPEVGEEAPEGEEGDLDIGSMDNESFNSLANKFAFRLNENGSMFEADSIKEMNESLVISGPALAKNGRMFRESFKFVNPLMSKETGTVMFEGVTSVDKNVKLKLYCDYSKKELTPVAMSYDKAVGILKESANKEDGHIKGIVKL